MLAVTKKKKKATSLLKTHEHLTRSRLMLVVTKKRKKIKKEKYDPFLAMTRLTDVSAIRVGGGKFGFTP